MRPAAAVAPFLAVNATAWRLALANRTATHMIKEEEGVVMLHWAVLGQARSALCSFGGSGAVSSIRSIEREREHPCPSPASTYSSYT